MMEDCGYMTEECGYRTEECGYMTEDHGYMQRSTVYDGLNKCFFLSGSGGGALNKQPLFFIGKSSTIVILFITEHQKP